MNEQIKYNIIDMIDIDNVSYLYIIKISIKLRLNFELIFLLRIKI